MNDSDIGELAKDVPLLNSGINTGIVVSTYPTKEHRDLLRAGKPGITPLNTSLGFRNARVPTDPKDPNYSQRHLIQTYRNNARPDHDLQGPQKREGSEDRMARILPTPTPAGDGTS